MQPCGVCGGMGIDAAGYCTQCGTYRGVPQAAPQSYDVVPPGVPAGPPSGPPMGPPAGPPSGPPGGTVYGSPISGPPISSAPYSGPPQYGAPYGGPTSAPPYGAPTSGAPYPTSGAPYPTSGAPPYPSTPTRGRSSFLVPLLALSATLVVLVVAIVVVVVVKSGNKGNGSGGTGDSLVDSCVVGDWNEKSHKESTPIEGFVGKVTFDGSGAVLHLKADGTGSYEYDGTEYTGTGRRANDDTVEIKLKITGTITFGYRTNNNTFSFSNMNATGSAVGFLDGQQIPGNQPLEPDTNPATYTCSGDDMSHTNSVYTVTWGRS
jgi:hypothetical protein